MFLKPEWFMKPVKVPLKELLSSEGYHTFVFENSPDVVYAVTNPDDACVFVDKDPTCIMCIRLSDMRMVLVPNPEEVIPCHATISYGPVMKDMMPIKELLRGD